MGVRNAMNQVATNLNRITLLYWPLRLLDNKRVRNPKRRKFFISGHGNSGGFIKGDEVYSLKVRVIGGEIVNLHVFHNLKGECIIGKKSISPFHLLASLQRLEVWRQNIRSFPLLFVPGILNWQD
jgi:hypothetical protein